MSKTCACVRCVSPSDRAVRPTDAAQMAWEEMQHLLAALPKGGALPETENVCAPLRRARADTHAVRQVAVIHELAVRALEASEGARASPPSACPSERRLIAARDADEEDDENSRSLLESLRAQARTAHARAAHCCTRPQLG
jgi:hypothetical protein